jgi:hypothetical protein
MKTKLFAAPAIGAFLLLISPDSAHAKVAQCKASNAAGQAYQGPCNFTAEERGSFSVEPLLKGKKILGATTVTVWVIEPGVADVSGLTSQGINSRWGEARRSTSDKACWVGSDFKICVY